MPIKLAAAYIRVSTDEQAEHGISLPAQKSRLLAYVQAQGWELYDYYMDDGYSGKDLDRPAMKKMIDDAQEKKFDYIVVLKLDRLSRRQKDVLYLLEDVFEVHNVGFKSVTEPFDTTTPFGKAAIGMMAVFAQLERETIVERVRMAKKEAARQGRFGGGGAPFGYIYDLTKKSLVVNDDAASTIELVYTLYETSQYGLRSLAVELDTRHIQSPSGGTWYKDTVKKVLTNPTYAGYIHRCGELTEGNHPPIIERSRWLHVQDMINGRYVPRPVKADNNLLAGIIYCGNCGARMRFKTQSWKNPKGGPGWKREYYICYSRAGYDRMVKNANCLMPFVKAEAANEAVVNHLMELSLSPSRLKDSIDAAVKKYDKSTALNEFTFVSKEIDSTKKKIDRWNNAFENGAIEIQDLLQRTKDLREKRFALEKRRQELENQIAEENTARIGAQDIFDQIKQFSIIWNNATPSEKRIIITSLVEQVVAYEDGHFDVILAI